MTQSTYAPGGPDRLTDDDISAVKSEYGLHSYDNPPADTPLSWMSEDEVRNIIYQDVFCYTRDERHYAGIVVFDEIVTFCIDYSADDVKEADDILRSATRSVLITSGSVPIVKTVTMSVRRMLEADAEGITSLHRANGNEYRRWLEVGKLYLRTYMVINCYSVSKTFRLATRETWKKSVRKGVANGKHMPKEKQREEMLIIFIVDQLRKIKEDLQNNPEVIYPANYETLIQESETMSATNTIHQRQEKMKVVGHIDLDNIPSGTKPVTIDELNNLIANLTRERQSLEDRVNNLRTMQADLEQKFPMPFDPFTQIEHKELKKPLSKRVKNLVHDYDFADENRLAFRRGTYEGVLCLRNFNGQLGFWFAFNFNGDGKTVEFEEGKVGDIVENMSLRYANTAEQYLCTALHEQMKHKIAAYKDAVKAKYDEACAVVEGERKTRYDEYEATITELLEQLQSITVQIEATKGRIAKLREEDARRKAAWKERDANEKTAKVVHVPATLPAVDGGGNDGAILQADEAVRAYAESPYPSAEDNYSEYSDFIDPEADDTVGTFDQMAIETAAAEGESYDIVIRALQNLQFIHHLRGKRITYGDVFPEIATVENFNSPVDEFAPFTAVAELTKLFAASRANTTHTCYITKSYLAKMAEFSQGVMAKQQSLLEIVPDGERFTGSFICPVDNGGGHHIYIFDVRRDEGAPRYRIAHLYDSELIGTCNFMYRGQFTRPYNMETYLPSKHVQVEIDDSNRWRKAQSNIDEAIVRAFVAMELTSDGVVKHELSEGHGEETATELKHGEYPNDIEIRDASWYTSVFVDKEIPVRGHTRRYWCGSGPDRHLEVRTIMPFTRSGYHRDAKNLR